MYEHAYPPTNINIWGKVYRLVSNHHGDALSSRCPSSSVVSHKSR